MAMNRPQYNLPLISFLLDKSKPFWFMQPLVEILLLSAKSALTPTDSVVAAESAQS